MPDADRCSRSCHVLTWWRCAKQGEGVVTKVRLKESGIETETGGSSTFLCWFPEPRQEVSIFLQSPTLLWTRSDRCKRCRIARRKPRLITRGRRVVQWWGTLGTLKHRPVLREQIVVQYKGRCTDSDVVEAVTLITGRMRCSPTLAPLQRSPQPVMGELCNSAN